jgi:Methyltransferase domain
VGSMVFSKQRISRGDYTSLEGWIAYNKLYWSNHPERVRPLCENIAEALPTNDRDILNVLVLGVGTGTIEFPVLAELERQIDKKIRIVAIDSYPQPLGFAAHVISNNGLSNLPSTTNDLILMMEQWSSQWNNISNIDSSESLSHYLFTVDIETKDSTQYNWQLDTDNNVVFDNLESIGLDRKHIFIEDNLDLNPLQEKNLHKCLPSRWKSRLQQFKGVVPEEGFDIVISSFCLLHLIWWRWTLSHGLALLNEGGLFLHSHPGGDKNLFRGLESPRNKFLSKLSVEEKHHFELEKNSSKFNNAKRIFVDTIFEDSIVKKYFESIERSNSFIKPHTIHQLLELLCSSGIEKKISDHEYVIVNTVGYSTYINLLKSRFFSPFQILEGVLPLKYYDKLVNGLSTNQGEENDVLLMTATWSGVKVMDRTKLLQSSMIRKFHKALLEDSQLMDNSAADSDFLLVNNYELDGCMMDIQLEQRNKQETDFQEDVARHLCSLGILSSKCIGGTVGRLKSEISGQQALFINPLYQSEKELNELTFNVILYRIVRWISPTSNSFFDSILPLTFKKHVMTYRFDAEIADPISLQAIDHHSFMEIRFSMNLENSRNLRNLLSSTIADIKKVQSDVLKDYIDNGNNYCFTIKLKSANKYVDFRRKVRNIIEEIIEDKEYKFKLQNDIDDLCLGYGKSKEMRKELMSFFCGEDNLIRTLSHILIDHKVIAVFPTTYYRFGKHDSKILKADESFRMIYPSDISDKEFGHEFNKFSFVINDRNSAAGQRDAIFDREIYQDMFLIHSIKNLVYALRQGWFLPVSEKGKKSEIVHKLYSDEDEYLEYKDDLDSLEWYVTPFLDLFENTADFLAIWCRIVSISMLESYNEDTYDLIQLLEDCWNLSKRSFYPQNLSSKKFDTIQAVTDLRKVKSDIKECFEKWNIIIDSSHDFPNILLQVDDEQDIVSNKWKIFIYILISLFRNVIEHGYEDEDEGVFCTCKIREDQNSRGEECIFVEVKNAMSNKKNPMISNTGNIQVLRNGFSQFKSSDGKLNVISELCEEVNGDYSIYDDSKEGYFYSRILIPVKELYS